MADISQVRKTQVRSTHIKQRGAKKIEGRSGLDPPLIIRSPRRSTLLSRPWPGGRPLAAPPPALRRRDLRSSCGPSLAPCGPQCRNVKICAADGAGLSRPVADDDDEIEYLIPELLKVLRALAGDVDAYLLQDRDGPRADYHCLHPGALRLVPIPVQAPQELLGHLNSYRSSHQSKLG